MSEDDDLAMSGLSNQAFSYGLPVHVVERGNGIVKDDAGLVFGSGEFGHERGQGNAAMLAFAQDLSHRSRGLPCKWGRLREGAESYAKALASDILR
ncbi:hypothetical protein MASR2M16_26200 [Thauera terpenica]